MAANLNTEVIIYTGLLVLLNVGTAVNYRRIFIALAPRPNVLTFQGPN